MRRSSSRDRARRQRRRVSTHAAESPGAMAPAIVAIVGRPNVGKSSLFNRLLEERRAVVEDEPGTTRDRLWAECLWQDRPIMLIDTGGLEPDPSSDLVGQVARQVGLAIGDADLLLFVVDGKDGLTAQDEAVAQQVRRAGKPALLVVNKVDNLQRELAAGEFYALGLGEPVLISAYHGLGIADMIERALEALPGAAARAAGLRVEEGPAEVEAVAEGPLKVALVGRPNVGKSLLLNAILGEERAIVSEVPGTTRDAIDSSFRWGEHDFLLIDTAGLRRRGQIEPGVERHSTQRTFAAIERADVAVLLIDASEGLTAQDAHIAGYAWEADRGLVIAANKGDLLPVQARGDPAFPGAIADQLPFAAGAPVCLISAKDKWGIEGVLQAAITVGAAFHGRVSTAILNQTLREAFLATPPPHQQGRPVRLYYATQVSVAPPTFVLFANTSEIHFSYRRYIENRLRAAFGFAGVPLRLVLRSRREESAR